MKIQSMFKDDINRKINGVVKVDQNEGIVLLQELNEYVITRELKKHFITFFRNYNESFSEYTADIGVWISGFFGSGKSHFLKILSYLLANEEIDGIKTVERFRKKFADDSEIFSLINSATLTKTETILFNIDIEGSINKDKTAVLRVFAKMFYNHLGFYGEDLKVAKLEQFISKQGKTEEFQRVFQDKNGNSWIESRNAYVFWEDDIVATMQEVLGMSEQSARNWFNGSEGIETSIAQFVSEIKDYVDNQPQDFRLLFMVDEVGQYVGGDTSMLINLQSLVEKIGSECHGKVWIICTGQEAIDEIIRARENEFSRIQARFKTRLSLSSSSADEVIQKRILLKTAEAEQILRRVYVNNESVLRNLFSFTNAVMDIRGYGSVEEFTRNFPFVPYQFILMQKVFAEIRRHGNSGTHLSGGERSMLSGFQEVAQKVENKDEYSLAPFYMFYDTVHTFLDSSIRRVIERCERAAFDGNGIEIKDVNVLKLLYLVRYIDDVKANLDNIVILMADNIQVDKITMREQVSNSLNRLLSQNYIGRSGDNYNFLTDEEQDIQREIRNTSVTTADIVGRIAEKIFGEIYITKKFRYGKYDFAFDRMVDGQVIGMLNNDIVLHVLTVFTDPVEKNELRLTTESVGKVIIVLEDNDYYEHLERALKIRKYIMQRNMSQLPKSVKEIISTQQDEARKYEKDAIDSLQKAILNAKFYIDGEQIEIKNGDAKSKIDKALEYLVTHVYSDIKLITHFSESDSDILAILRGTTPTLIGDEHNKEAASKMENYLDVKFKQNLPTTMFDLQQRFQKKPYGWREIDIASVVAMLIFEQKVTVKYSGMTIQPNDAKLLDMLRKKSEIGKTTISKRQAISAQKIRDVREFLLDFFGDMNVPKDEDGLVAHTVNKFEGELKHYTEISAKYFGHNYPDQDKVNQTIELMKNILSQQKDNTALIQRVIDRQDELYDMRDELQNVEEFFKTRVDLFDCAVKYAQDLRDDKDYIGKNDEAYQALTQIRLIITIPADDNFNYGRIPQLNELLAKLKACHEKMLDEKRAELLEIVRQCMEKIHTSIEDNMYAKKISNTADDYFTEKKKQIASYQKLALLDGLVPQMWRYKDEVVSKIEAIVHPPVKSPVNSPPTQKEKIKAIHRQFIFPAEVLKSEDEIDAYIDKIRANMKKLLKGNDGIKIS